MLSAHRNLRYMRFFFQFYCFAFIFSLFDMHTTLVTINSHYIRVYQFCALRCVCDAYFVDRRLQCSFISGNLFNRFSSVALVSWAYFSFIRFHIFRSANTVLLVSFILIHPVHFLYFIRTLVMGKILFLSFVWRTLQAHPSH